MKVALIAHWDPDSIVDPYVLYYIQSLKNLGYIIILISTRPVDISDSDVMNLDSILWRNCPGYDFTSWKAAFEYYPSLFEASEILITNDSIFGPIYPLSDIHNKMSQQKYDFWGLFASNEELMHIQSYYIVFQSKTIKSQAFYDFFDSVDTIDDKEKVIKEYELGLTRWLQCHGLIAGAYLSSDDFPPIFHGQSLIHTLWRQSIRDFKIPFIKRDLIAKKNWWFLTQDWEKELQKTNYPVGLIKNYFNRLNN